MSARQVSEATNRRNVRAEFVGLPGAAALSAPGAASICRLSKRSGVEGRVHSCYSGAPLPHNYWMTRKPKAASLFVTLIFMVAGPLPGAIIALHAARHPKFPPRSYATRATPIKQTKVWTVSTPTLAGQTEHKRLP